MTGVPTTLAEQTEASAYADFALSAPPELQSRMGIAATQLGGVRAVSIEADESHFFDRAGGFGAEEPITEDVIDRVCTFFGQQRVPLASLHIAPSLLPPQWATIAERFGLTESRVTFVKLGALVDAVLSGPDGLAALDPALRVETVTPERARAWGSAMMSHYGIDTPRMDEVASACVGRPGWQQFAVLEGERIVGVASLHVFGECADLFGAATAPDARGRGAQSALLTARAHAANAAGCRWLVAETNAEGPGDHNTSLHNMIRAGLSPLYRRAGWVWHA